MTDGGLRRGVITVLVLGVLLAVAANVATVFSVQGIASEVHIITQRQLMEEITQATGAVAHAKWKSGGIEIVVDTPKPAKLPNETEAELRTRWAADHKANVDAMLVQYPKDP